MIKILINIIKYIAITGIVIIMVTSGVILAHYWSQADKPADCAVVLGAAVWSGNRPSHALYDRTMSGIELYQNKEVNCIVFSGGQSAPNRTHEVDVMSAFAASAGVPNTQIVRDYNGVNTLATVTNLRKLPQLEKLSPNNSFIFISNDFHLARIALFAKRAKIDDFQLQYAKYNYGRYTKEPQFFAREVIAYLYYLFNLNNYIIR